MSPFSDFVSTYIRTVNENLSSQIGEPEAQLTTPVANLLVAVGSEIDNQEIVVIRETRIEDGAARPDFGVQVDGLLVGHVELKKPGVSLDPDTYKSGHNKEQWEKLRNLPNLLHTDGTEWRLWHYGELVDIVNIHRKGRNSAELLNRFKGILQKFLNWSPVPISTTDALVNKMGMLAALLRAEVLEQLKLQRKLAKNPKIAPRKLPLPALKEDWRSVLYPRATDEEFADGFAQTIIFALILALTEGKDIDIKSLHNISRELQENHGLLGNALGLLTEHISEQSELYTTLTIITRTFSAVDWESISRGSTDVYLHLYEHFLNVYDPELRKKTGSYYTPVEVVDSMVRITDEALRLYLNKPMGLASDGVAVIDPAMGTGTYPLSVLRSVAENPDLLGPGEVKDRINYIAENLYGFELQSGSFSVAELRVSQTLEQLGGTIPAGGLNLFVADTLENPKKSDNARLSYSLQLIAEQRIKANRIKKYTPIQVCIGNPPYKDKAEGMGGWIEQGDESQPLLADFKSAGNGRLEYVLKNLYVYFWRWAFWKVFESVETSDAGVVCFITADGYLRGPGFAGMREYIRRNTSRGWIINLTPEGKQPPAKNAIFNIETPVSVALFVREPNNSVEVPSDIKYVSFEGTREEKFAAFKELTLDSELFQDVRTGWHDKFSPKAEGEWDSYLAMHDIFCWQSPGIKPNKTWVYAPHPDVLEFRWNELADEADKVLREEKFRETRDSSLYKGKKPLPGTDTQQGTENPLNQVFDHEIDRSISKVVQVAYRSFDRQNIIADSRVLATPRPNLWAARSAQQIFVVEQHAHFPKAGPGLMMSALIPDMDMFNNRGGRAHPLFHPDGSPNIVPELSSELSELLGLELTDSDILYYLAGLTAHPGYVETFEEELQEAGIRIPLSARADLWEELIALGKNIVWLHTYGERGEPLEGISSLKETAGEYSMPVYQENMVSMPEKKPTWLVKLTKDGKEYENALQFGTAIWSNVDQRVFEYTVGGVNVIGSWAGYRLKKPLGKKTSPLNDIVQGTWPREWSREFSELLSVLTHLVNLEEQQKKLLTKVLANPLFLREKLEEQGVVWPTPKDRKPKMA
ncbi:N-6 DNA methylase [Rothia amarae]|uniref:site-specific DNA-methyltransferase (adenine-specific) n=1 Tax=Rothia amarae TaxID=169480 RepID=A0A7H2BKR5_9MICC|nr:type ISP restriction/modification enzyme [Rothia amarae]QNV40261.1 N-6 DNA methylase [Rothia amarae]